MITRTVRKSLVAQARSSVVREDHRKLRPPKLGAGPGDVSFSAYVNFLSAMSGLGSRLRPPPAGTRFKL